MALAQTARQRGLRQGIDHLPCRQPKNALWLRQFALSVSNVELNQDLGDTVTDLELTRQKVEKLAFKDPPTGLANRRLFRDRLEQAMKMRLRGDEFALQLPEMKGAEGA
jgi:PleD family two-component response regulator